MTRNPHPASSPSTLALFDASLAAAADADVGEGPCWDARDDRLLWVDIPRGVVHRLDPSNGTDDPIHVREPVGAIVPRTVGGYVAAARSGFLMLDDDGSVTTSIPVMCSDPTVRMNDGKCDPRGRFWAGSMSDEETPGAGSLYRLAVSGEVTTVLHGITISNGLAWNLDRALMYFIDSATQRIDVFDYDDASGDIGARRSFATIPTAVGIPDGMTIDTDGCLWVAFWGGGAVRRIAQSGTMIGEIRLPVSQVSSCTFGGPDRGDLYITSAREGLPSAADEPLAGSVFRARPGPSGLPATMYAG